MLLQFTGELTEASQKQLPCGPWKIVSFLVAVKKGKKWLLLGRPRLSLPVV